VDGESASFAVFDDAKDVDDDAPRDKALVAVVIG